MNWLRLIYFIFNRFCTCVVTPALNPFDTIPPLPCIGNDFRNFRRHGPRMNISASSRTPHPFVASIAAQDPTDGSPRSRRFGHGFAHDPGPLFG